LDKEEYQQFLETLDEEEKAFLNSGKNFYEITIENVGGLVMPLIFELEYENGETEIRRIPVEIWKMSTPEITKVLITDRPVVRITLDPMLEIADVDMSNNHWPSRPEPTRFQIFKNNISPAGENPMQRANRGKKK
ncbi:MAG: M1 family peptidase, partial [Bacteroidota bacterium]